MFSSPSTRLPSHGRAASSFLMRRALAPRRTASYVPQGQPQGTGKGITLSAAAAAADSPKRRLVVSPPYSTRTSEEHGIFPSIMTRSNSSSSKTNHTSPILQQPTTTNNSNSKNAQHCTGVKIDLATQAVADAQKQQPQPQQPQKPPYPAIITSMDDFIEQVPWIVNERKEKDIVPGSPDDPVIQLFRQTRMNENEWSRYAFFDASKPYTRNLIATDYHTYSLLLLCWNAQHESPIHDHPCDGCWLQVLKGTIQECLYDESLQCTSDQTFGSGQIAYITDQMGYHKIGNPSVDTPAVSLHLYAPPIQHCRTWRPLPAKDDDDRESSISSSTTTTGTCSSTAIIRYQELSSCLVTHYSEFGCRVDGTGQSVTK